MNFASRYFAPRYFAPRYFGTKRKVVPLGGGGAGVVLPFAARRPRIYTHSATGGMDWAGSAVVRRIGAEIAAGKLLWSGAARCIMEPSRYVLARQEDELWLLAE